jgi:hypothetical protein
MIRRLAVPALFALAAVGCSTGTEPPTELQYWSDAKPVIDANCVSCHKEGGGAPFALDTYEAVTTYATAIADAVETGRMPPWLPSTDCREYPGQRVMPDDDKSMLLDWIEQGTLEGDIANAVVVDPPNLDLPTVSLALTAAEAYTPNADRPDDYRCILLDHTFDSDAFITGYQVAPDQTALVHHVLLYVIPPESLPDFNAVDDADPGPGFTCFSDPGVDSMLFGTWVPGAPATTLPNNIGFEVPAGSRLAMQVHYNLVANTPAPDRTAVQVQLADVEPYYLAQNLILVEDDFQVPPGATDYEVSATFENTFPFPVTVLSALPHMHLLGKSIRFDKVDANGNEECIVDIPRWDFNWQQTYDLGEDDFVVIEPGEATKVTCSWDNSQQNQPVINGEQAEPVTVTWGEGTLEEMCVVIITAVPDRL